MSRILFVPTISLDVSLLERLANSVDTHVDYKVAWNNGKLGALDEFASRHPDWIVKDSAFGNIGCAGSWNEAAKIFPDEPSILILNDDAWFLPGYLEEIFKCAKANEDAPIVHMNDSNAYYAFVTTRAGREKFGPFDDNFYVAYLEDADMRVRHRMGGIYTYPYALQGLPPLPHGKPRTGGVNYAAMIQGCGLFNRAYWRKKWGSDNYEQAHYATPYNDQRLTCRDVVWYPGERAARFELWNCFINMPNPSIYT